MVAIGTLDVGVRADNRQFVQAMGDADQATVRFTNDVGGLRLALRGVTLAGAAAVGTITAFIAAASGSVHQIRNLGAALGAERGIASALGVAREEYVLFANAIERTGQERDEIRDLLGDYQELVGLVARGETREIALLRDLNIDAGTARRSIDNLGAEFLALLDRVREIDRVSARGILSQLVGADASRRILQAADNVALLRREIDRPIVFATEAAIASLEEFQAATTAAGIQLRETVVQVLAETNVLDVLSDPANLEAFTALAAEAARAASFLGRIGALGLSRAGSFAQDLVGPAGADAEFERERTFALAALQQGLLDGYTELRRVELALDPAELVATYRRLQEETERQAAAFRELRASQGGIVATFSEEITVRATVAEAATKTNEQEELRAATLNRVNEQLLATIEAERELEAAREAAARSARDQYLYELETGADVGMVSQQFLDGVHRQEEEVERIRLEALNRANEQRLAEIELQEQLQQQDRLARLEILGSTFSQVIDAAIKDTLDWEDVFLSVLNSILQYSLRNAGAGGGGGGFSGFFGSLFGGGFASSSTGYPGLQYNNPAATTAAAAAAASSSGGQTIVIENRVEVDTQGFRVYTERRAQASEVNSVAAAKELIETPGSGINIAVRTIAQET